MKKSCDKYFIIMLLLIVLGLFLRLDGFSIPHQLTFDEMIYAKLSLQLKNSVFNYNTEAIYDFYTSQGRYLPSYLSQPLFKHPPLFCFMGTLFQKFYPNPLWASYITSLIFGLALIPLTFCIGTYLFNRQTGLLAAFLITLDPITWACSQKVWLETMLTFFVILAFYCLVKAIVDKKNHYFIWAALASGFAILTKATGFIIIFFAFSLILIYNPSLFKKKAFWLYNLIIFIMYLPWLIWNYSVYKINFLSSLISVQNELSFTFFIYIASFILFSSLLLLLIKRQQLAEKITNIRLTAFQPVITISLILFFLTPYLLKGLFHSFNLFYMPPAGWRLGFFDAEPSLFYIRRLIELSPFYLIAVGGLAFLNKLDLKQKLLYAWGFMIIIIFTIHCNFQSRYLLPAIPAFLILSAGYTEKILTYINYRYKNKKRVYGLLLLGVTVIFLYFLIKTLLIDLILIAPNNIAYF